MERSVEIKFPAIEGNVSVVVSNEHDNGSVYLAGDPTGLLSLAKILTELAGVDQKQLPSLPLGGATEHLHLEPNLDLSANSRPLVVGRLDDKQGNFDVTFQARSEQRNSPFVHRW